MWHPLHVFRRARRSGADFSEEIETHLALEADRLVAEGASRQDALLEARRRFGNVGQVRETFHRARTVWWLESVPAQLRRATRRLVRAPAFSVTTTLTLMIGIGAATAVFSLVEGVLLRPLPFVQPDRLVEISHTLQVHGLLQVDESDATYLYYRSANRVLSGLGAYRTVSVNLAAPGAGGPSPAERVEAARASASVFGVLGIAPRQGRVFRADEDLPGAAPVVILSEPLWRRKYAADPDILGRQVLIDGVPHTIVGIMPSRFTFPDASAALWLPIAIDPSRTATAAFIFHAVGRLRPGITADSAAAALQPLLSRVPEAYPGRLTTAAIGLTHMRVVVRPLLETAVGRIGRMLWVVFGAAVALLLIVCANVANLFLVRAEERQHDVTVRRALGAGRGEILTEFLAEAVLLTGLGSCLGLVLAQLSVAVLRSHGAGVAIPRLTDVGLDGMVMALVGAVAVCTALVVSVVPALRASSPDVATALARTGSRVSAGHERHRARRALVILQVALALVLVTGAGLMARTFSRLRAVPSGFDAAAGYTFRLVLPTVSYPTTASVVEFVTRAIDELGALPGVRAAGVVTKLPLDDAMRRDTAVFIADRPPAMGQLPVIHQVDYVSPGAFSALGIPMLEGRTFEPPDAGRAPLEVVVTRTLARRYWGDGPAVGRRLALDPAGPQYTVVGVTGDIRGSGLDQPPDETVFLPLVTAPGPATAGGGEGPARWAPRNLAFVVRSDAGASDILVPVQRTLRALAPTVPLYAARTLKEVVARSTARTSITLALLEVASLAALLIGAVGLYAVVSYMVSLRKREIAMRMALGAEPGALLRQVLAEAMGVAGVGILLGLGATIALTRGLTVMLYGVAPNDPATLLGAAGVMAAVAAAASWLPAHRAAGVDPATALRTDR